MKNFLISALLLAFFSVSLFAADETKVNDVLTREIQLELAVLYGVYSVAGDVAACSVGAAAGDSVREAVRVAAGAAARDATWVAVGDSAGATAWSAATAAAGATAKAAAGDRARNPVIASWISAIEEFRCIEEKVQKRTKSASNINVLLKEFKLQESVEPCSSVIANFHKSFNDPRYKQMLEPIKTFYVVSLAIIFPKCGFEESDEFMAYTNNIATLIGDATQMSFPLCLLIGEYTGDSLDTDVLHMYVLEKLHKLEDELKQKPKRANRCCVS